MGSIETLERIVNSANLINGKETGKETMKTAYTIGRTMSYDQALNEGPVYKTGARDDYFGGWVWKTVQEAEDFLKTTHLPFMTDLFSIYELKLPHCWKENVSTNPDIYGVHNLLNNAEIIEKVNTMTTETKE